MPGPGVRLGAAGGVALTTRPAWTTWFQPGPSLSCLADGWTRFAFGAAGVLGAPSPSLRTTGARLASAAMCLLPFHIDPIFGCVVSSTAAALKMLWGGALHWEVSLTRSNTPGCATTLPLRMAEALTRWHCRSIRGDVSTETRKPQSSVRERSFVTSGPRAADNKVRG